MKELLKNAPKVELHCHLDGSLELEAIRELAVMSSVDLPAEDTCLLKQLRVSEDCQSLVEYLEKFELPLALLQTEPCLEYAAYSLVKAAADEQVIYLEVRFAPLLHLREGLDKEQVVESVIRGLKRGEAEFGVKSAALLCAMRHDPVEENLPLVNLARQYLGKGVCGLDLAGDELHYPVMLHKALFDQARQWNIPYTIHAGESGSAESVRDALALGAGRIGHGIALKDEDEILKMAVDSGCGIEMCPTSNYQTKAVSNGELYPFIKFLEAGLCVTVNTDNRMVSGTTLTKEFELLWDKFGLNREQVRTVTLNGVRAAFTSEEIKRQLAQQVNTFWDKA